MKFVTALFLCAINAYAQTPSDVLKRDYYGSTLKSHISFDRFVPAGQVVFVGDSIVQNMEPPPLGAANFGISGDTTAGLLYRLPRYAALKSARAVLLNSGLNDMGFGAQFDRRIPGNYRKMLAMVPTGTKVFILAILPVNETVAPGFTGYNARIKLINKAVAQACVARPGCAHIDISTALVDRAGNTRVAYLRPKDPIHLNHAGYAILNARLTAVLGGDDQHAAPLKSPPDQPG